MMSVTITEEDIAQGVRASPTQCPLARALSRTTGRRWSVGRWSAIDAAQPLRHHVLTQEAAEFVYNFDCGNRVLPESFRALLT